MDKWAALTGKNHASAPKMGGNWARKMNQAENLPQAANRGKIGSNKSQLLSPAGGWKRGLCGEKKNKRNNKSKS